MKRMSKAGWGKDHADTMRATILASLPISDLTCPCCGQEGGCSVSNPTHLDENHRRCDYGCIQCGGEWTIVWDDRTDQPTLEGEPR